MINVELERYYGPKIVKIEENRRRRERAWQIK
jgi:hypothetical protein